MSQHAVLIVVSLMLNGQGVTEAIPLDSMNSCLRNKVGLMARLSHVKGLQLLDITCEPMKVRPTFGHSGDRAFAEGGHVPPPSVPPRAAPALPAPEKTAPADTAGGRAAPLRPRAEARARPAKAKPARVRRIKPNYVSSWRALKTCSVRKYRIVNGKRHWYCRRK